jgi:excisionase family DNA binding protein
MLDINGLAEKLCISRNTALKLVQEGKIKAIKVGKQYRISEENYNQFITASEVTPFTNAGGKSFNPENPGGVIRT